MSHTPTVDQAKWQEEELTVPSLSFDVQFDEYGNPVSMSPKMVEEKVKRRYTQAQLLPHQICGPQDHYFEMRNSGKRVSGRVEVQCRSCSYGRNFVIGCHRLQDGKILTLGVDF